MGSMLSRLMLTSFFFVLTGDNELKYNEETLRGDTGFYFRSFTWPKVSLWRSKGSLVNKSES